MSLLYWFDSSTKKVRLSHVKNMMAVALSDKHLGKDELGLIFTIGARAGLSKSELERILNEPESVSFYPPDNWHDRIEQLFDLTMVMMVDGEIDTIEMVICKAIAIRMGFKPQVIDHIVQEMINLINRNISREVAILQLLQVLNRM